MIVAPAAAPTRTIPRNPSAATASPIPTPTPSAREISPAPPVRAEPLPPPARAYGSAQPSASGAVRPSPNAAATAENGVGASGHRGQRRRLHEEVEHERRGPERADRRLAHDLERALSVAGPEAVGAVGEGVEVDRPCQESLERHRDRCGE